MVMEHYEDRWSERVAEPQPRPLTPDELVDLRKLIERAKDYDIQNNEPNCGLEEKRQRLIDLAKELGAEVTFL